MLNVAIYVNERSEREINFSKLSFVIYLIDLIVYLGVLQIVINIFQDIWLRCPESHNIFLLFYFKVTVLIMFIFKLQVFRYFGRTYSLSFTNKFKLMKLLLVSFLIIWIAWVRLRQVQEHECIISTEFLIKSAGG